jgi:hypothetical protein
VSLVITSMRGVGVVKAFSRKQSTPFYPRLVSRFGVITLYSSLNYVRSIEIMFGTPGLANRQTFMWCGAESAAANKQNPLVVTTE